MSAAERGGIRRDPPWPRQFALNLAAGWRAVTRPARGPRPAWPLRSRLMLGALLTLLAVLSAMVLLDAWSLAHVRSLPASLVAFFAFVTDFGLSGWWLYPLAAALLFLAAMDRPSLPLPLRGALAALAARLGFVFAAIAVPGLAVAIVKRVIARARPFVGGTDVWAYGFPAWRPDYASFPSGHATAAFSAAVAVGAVWPRARPVMWGYAGMIALSRVAVAAHHPSDVIAGAVAGSVGALLVRHWFAARRLAFTVSREGRIRAWPAPSWRRIKAVARRLIPA